MAEIQIEKRKPIWPWVLAGLVILAFIIIYFVSDDNGTRYTQQDTQFTAPYPAPAPVPAPAPGTTTSQQQDHNAREAYVEFVREENGRMGEDHQYTHDALHKLTEAVRSLADEKGHDISADLNQAEQAANEITRDHTATDHSLHIRNAAEALTTALTNMQQAYYPDLQDDVEELHNTTESIDPDQLTLQQRDAVNSFFAQSADLIEKMD
jgi:hypothetical protein